MTTALTCPTCGQQSDEPDYCSSCGHKLGGVAASTTSNGATRSTRTAPPSVRSARSDRNALSSRSASVRGLASTRNTHSTRSTSRRLGGSGIVPLPPLPPLDPIARVIEGVVPERKRYCGGVQGNGSACTAKLSREYGFCPVCGTKYDFRASLKPGDVLDDKYEIKGPMAYGGLGWIYLAWDRDLARWCVLKGLINSNDPSLEALARQESQFLASLNHPNVVQVFTFVRHGSEGFIVMELVNGKNLLQIRRETAGPLPVPLAISYILNILPAFGYLDSRGLVYMDMKLENVMVADDGQGNSVEKLIDLGAVRRADDTQGDLFATVGYSAPEVSANPPLPTPVSDLFCVGRALVLLVCDFAFQDGRYQFALPGPDEVPVFAEHESLYRFLTKATAEAPDARFQTADEMAQQLLGVLREELAGTAEGAELGAYHSSLFETDALFGGDLWGDEGRSIRSLPALRLDPLDTGASAVLASSAILDPAKRLESLQASLAALPTSTELRLRMADLHIDRGEFADAETPISAVERADSFNWRVAWYRGKSLLAQGKTREALSEFDNVLGELPGELALKLAIGLGYELAADPRDAIVYYESVARTDPLCTAAAFGLARAHLLEQDRAAAAAALERVSASSVRYAQAQLAMASVLADGGQEHPSLGDLQRAARVLDGLKGLIDGLPAHKTAADFFRVAAEVCENGTRPAPHEQLLGVAATPSALRAAAERELRACARFATDRNARIEFVDLANRVRPRTLW
jgi:serine/threonine-protein kinase PknG